MHARQMLVNLAIARRLVGRAAVAKVLGVSTQTVKSWESGAFAPSLRRSIDDMGKKLDRVIEKAFLQIEEGVDQAIAGWATEA